MLLFLFLFGLALANASPSGDREVKLEQGDCPMSWYSFNSRCYKYVAGHMTWADAELHCVSEKANLVSIHSLEEEKFVQSLIKNFDYTEGFTWIGLNDIPKENRWMWSDGCPVDFVFWDIGEPGGEDKDENCVHNNHGHDMQWNDRACSNTFPSVCASRIICP